MHGGPQSIETLINVKALLLAKYLRGGHGTLIPRVPFLFPTLFECEVAIQASQLILGNPCLFRERRRRTRRG